MMRIFIFITTFFFLLTCYKAQVPGDTIFLQKIISELDAAVSVNPVKAIEIGKNAEAGINDNTPLRLKIWLYRRIAEAYLATGNNKTAFGYLNKALLIANTDVRKASVHNSLGGAYARTGDLTAAIEHLLKSVFYYEAANAIDDNWAVKQNLAICYAQTGQLTEALRYFKEVMKILEKSGAGNHVKAEAYVNLGVIYEMLNNPDTTLMMYQKAHSILLSEGSSPSLAMLLNNMGTVLVKLNKLNEGVIYLNKSMRMMMETGDKQGAILTMNNISDINFKAGKFREALKYAERAYDKADSLGYLHELISSSDKLADAYYKLGDLNNAYLFERKYAKLKDSLTSKEKFEQIAEMQAKYESEKKEKEISLLNKDKQLQQSQLSKEKNFRYFVIGIAVLVILIAVLLFYSLRSKQKTNRELDIKNKKIEQAYHLIEEKQKEILDSIHYAKRIQKSLLPPEKYIDRSLNKLM